MLHRQPATEEDPMTEDNGADRSNGAKGAAIHFCTVEYFPQCYAAWLLSILVLTRGLAQPPASGSGRMEIAAVRARR
jgi:hypothetical protein